MSDSHSTGTRLTIIREIGRDRRSRMIVLVRCSCGTEKEMRLDGVKNGHVRSCGCLMKETQVKNGRANRRHGQSRSADGKAASPEWRAWRAMIQRCCDPNKDNYRHYGGQGVKVCERWQGKDGFVNFLADMGPKPSPKHTIDRFPIKEGDYSPENCRWATMKEQARNTRRNRMIEFQGRTLCAAAWDEEMGFPANVVKNRLRLGWSVEEAITTPVKKRK